MPELADSTRKVVLGDLDGDGDLDLVVGNSRGEQDRLYTNDGTGVFTDATADSLPDDAATNTDIDLIDLNDDGSLDIFVTNVGDFVSGHGFLGEPNRLLFNDGDGRFFDATFPRLAERDGRSTNADLGDVNGDGVVDVVVANSGGVDRADLPPPDGAERLFIRRGCDWNTTLCHQAMLDGIHETIVGLSTAAFPDGDMSSSNPSLNEARRRLLARYASGARSALDNGGAIRFAIRLWQVVQRADGRRRPPDWAVGGAADRIDGYGRFSFEVLFDYGL